MSSTSKKKVINSLTEDKARVDASHEYSKNSIEPAAEGAFKGALSSSIASRLARESKFVSKRLPKTKSETLLVGAGTALGALAGKIHNDKKVEKAKKARDWLSNKKKKSAYIKSTREIYKQSNEYNIVDPRTVTPEQARQMMYAETQKKKKEASDNMSPKDIAKDTAMWGIGGAVIGGLAGRYKGLARAVLSKAKMMKPASSATTEMLKRSRGARGLAGAAKWGALGGATTAVQDTASSLMSKANGPEKENDKNAGLKAAASGAAMVGAGGAVEPMMNRLIGKHVIAKTDKFGDIAKDTANEAKGYKSKPAGRFNSFSKYIPFMGEGKSAEARQIQKGIDAAKNNKSIFTGLGKTTLRSTSRYGLAGAGLMYGMHRLGESLSDKNNQIKKTASMSGDDMINAENADARDVLNSSRIASVARKAGVAAAAYGAGKYFGGTHSAGVKSAGLATAMYSAPKMLKEEYDRYSAKDFLSKNRGQKLSSIRKKEDGKKFGAEDLIGAYVGARVTDNVIGPRDVNANVNMKNKSQDKKKFSIKDSL